MVLCPQQVTDMCTTHRMGRDGHCQQFDTPSTLISASQWPHRPCNAPIRPYRIGKKPSVKANLAMYSDTVDVSRQCMSVSLILGCKSDFSSCTMRASFCKSSHIWCLLYCLSCKFTYVACLKILNELLAASLLTRIISTIQ